jgi:anti-anti-sigma factor
MSAHNANPDSVLSFHPEGDTLTVRVNGEVDLNNSPHLRTSLLDQVARHSPRRLVMNLAKVSYMDSSGIAVLVELLRRVGKGGKVILTDLQPRVKGLLEIARLTTIFIIAATEQDAVGK